MTASDHKRALLIAGPTASGKSALALEKADVSMRVAAKVRNKLVEAYQEVMRMPV